MLKPRSTWTETLNRKLVPKEFLWDYVAKRNLEQWHNFKIKSCFHTPMSNTQRASDSAWVYASCRSWQELGMWKETPTTWSPSSLAVSSRCRELFREKPKVMLDSAAWAWVDNCSSNLIPIKTWMRHQIKGTNYPKIIHTHFSWNQAVWVECRKNI